MKQKGSLASSFSYALRGIGWAIVHERNIKIHLFFAVIALLASWLLKISVQELALILIVIFFVLAAEMVNTALEQVVDLTVGERYHELAKNAKDTAAGAVLLTAICSISIGVLIFLPKIFRLLGGN
ncbi:MAG: diacylglycerol kinase family protein [Bacillota bacterium]|nr:diacylglycerol kinase family protein [Bacillota bacterium]